MLPARATAPPAIDVPTVAQPRFDSEANRRYDRRRGEPDLQFITAQFGLTRCGPFSHYARSFE